MGSREFWFSVLASVVAAAVLEATGLTNAFQILRRSAELPLWAIILLTAAPIGLSILWFRKAITPAHRKLAEHFSELEAKYRVAETDLASLRANASTQDEIFKEVIDSKRILAAELDDWKSRGVKLFKDGDQLEQIVSRKFGAEIIDMDGKDFVGCIFRGSILRYKGIAPVRLEHIECHDVRWVMDVPASSAFNLLGAMYVSGSDELRQLVENTFANIKAGGNNPA
jgi:hypothetical protein